ncbi:terpenoid cyclases/protein prenyltransferase alpha-alpha toroid [Peziza echinospora]|nr:terpenoid cyclases/protein prenyltransferase alpha-alpha toroid [Peziza echinospora]
MTDQPQPSSPPQLHIQKHHKYWLRCLKTLLPSAYTSTDLSRLSLTFFILSALDILGLLESSTTPQERKEYADWIYEHCQVSGTGGGGFRGAPATRGSGERWDVANVPAGYFALACLAILGDGGGRVDRKGALGVLRGCQRGNGGFGEWCLKGGVGGGESGEEGELVMGGDDMRYMYCAAATRWMLNGGRRGRRRGGEGAEDGEEEEEEPEDIDVEKAVEFIKSAETYDHGFSASPYLEAHAGMTYCALGALSLLGKLPPPSPSDSADTDININTTNPAPTPTIIDLPPIIKWLVDRQVPYHPSPSSEDDEDSTTTPTPPTPALPITTTTAAGFQGRTGKLADTCYSFWVGGSLDILGHASLINHPLNREFLLGKTQHLIGGFGKLPGVEYRPDILHSYMGLVGLSIMGEEGLRRVDSALCVSVEARERVRRWGWF